MIKFSEGWLRDAHFVCWCCARLAAGWQLLLRYQLSKAAAPVGGACANAGLLSQHIYKAAAIRQFLGIRLAVIPSGLLLVNIDQQ